MVDLLRFGGSLILTCAGPGFQVHEVDTAPEAAGVPRGTYYAGVRPDEIFGVIRKAAAFRDVYLNLDEKGRDTCVFAYSKEIPC